MNPKNLAIAVTMWWITAVLTALPANAQHGNVGQVFTMTNDPAGNSVLVFNRAADGSLTSGPAVPTGGLGTGGMEPDFGLANAHALATSADRRFLFVVNPGSNDISLLSVKKEGLTLLDRVSSGGTLPISVAVSGNLLYVLNAGGDVGASDNITGFTITPQGLLSELSGSNRPLSASVTNPAQIGFSPDGKVLIVTERVANNIDTYMVGKDGLATGPSVTPDDAQNPFGFYVANGNQIFISDDFNDAVGEGSLSSYLVFDDGSLQLVSSAVMSGESGACWVVVSQDGRFAYVTNTVSSTVSVYKIDTQTASVTFADSATSFASPTDLDFSGDGRLLYVLNPDQHAQASPGINVFSVNKKDGTLKPLAGGVSGLPTSVDGLVAF